MPRSNVYLYILGIIFFGLLLTLYLEEVKIKSLSETILMRISESGVKQKSENDQKYQHMSIRVNHNRTCVSRANCKPGTKRILPGALIIGVSKAGTTALEWFLKLHDQIDSGQGEPHYYDENYHRGVSWYCTKMPCGTDDTMVLERTPRYYVRTVQDNVYDFKPSMKLILVVREPVDRTISHLVHNYGIHSWNHYESIVFNSDNTVKEEMKQVFMSQYVK